MDTELKERIRVKINAAFNGLKPDIRKPAIENFTEIFEDIYALNDKKVSSSEIRLLIQEMHSRFDKTDMKLESLINELHTYQKVTDKRLEDMMHHSDKRFEVIDKRFEDLMHHSDKRFGAIDKRFEDMNKRFTSLQWFIGIGFTLLAALITIFTYFNQLPNAAP